MPATCCAGGLGKWEATHIEQLKNAGVQQVAVISDDGAESRADAQAVACACHAAGLGVRVVDLAGPVKDVSAYLDKHTESDLAALIEAAPPLTGPVPTRLSEASGEPVSWLWPGWIPEGSVTLLDGSPGVGKTLITLDLAARVYGPHDARRPAGTGEAGRRRAGDRRRRHARGDAAPRCRGADMTRIDHLPRDGDRLPTDADFGAIFGAVVAAKAKLVVLDSLLPIVPLSGASCTDRELRSTLAKLARPSRSAGRSSGVVVVFVQRPCRSGSPHAVRGAADSPAPPAGAWAKTPSGARTASAYMTNAATRHRWVILASLLPAHRISCETAPTR